MTQAPTRPAPKDDDALNVRARLEDSHFMLRVRIDGGQLDLDQLGAIGDPGLTGADPRSGRWSGFAKTECGIHA
jgi:hypothetical protein